jgi:hypothetical protein
MVMGITTGPLGHRLHQRPSLAIKGVVVKWMFVNLDNL